MSSLFPDCRQQVKWLRRRYDMDKSPLACAIKIIMQVSAHVNAATQDLL